MVLQSYIEGLEKHGQYRVSVSGGKSSLIHNKVLWGQYTQNQIVSLKKSGGESIFSQFSQFKRGFFFCCCYCNSSFFFFFLIINNIQGP